MAINIHFFRNYLLERLDYKKLLEFFATVVYLTHKKCKSTRGTGQISILLFLETQHLTLCMMLLQDLWHMVLWEAHHGAS